MTTFKQLLLTIIGILTPMANLHAMEPSRLSPEKQKEVNAALFDVATDYYFDSLQTLLSISTCEKTVQQTFHFILKAYNFNKVRNKKVRLLLEAKADPNYPPRGDTLLTCLAQRRVTTQGLEMIRMLIAANADPNLRGMQRDFDGNTYPSDTPLMIAAALPKSHKLITLLIEAKADLELRDFQGRSALDVAVRYNDTKNVQALLNAKASTNTSDMSDYYNTPLMHATYQNNNNIIRALLAAGASLNIRNRENIRAYDLAMLQRYTDISNTMDTEYTTRLKLRKQMKRELVHGIHASHAYLLDGPLPITPLADIFLTYALDPSHKSPFTDAMVCTRRAEDTARETQKQRETYTRIRKNIVKSVATISSFIPILVLHALTECPGYTQ